MMLILLLLLGLVTHGLPNDYILLRPDSITRNVLKISVTLSPFDNLDNSVHAACSNHMDTQSIGHFVRCASPMYQTLRIDQILSVNNAINQLPHSSGYTNDGLLYGLTYVDGTTSRQCIVGHNIGIETLMMSLKSNYNSEIWIIGMGSQGSLEFLYPEAAVRSNKLFQIQSSNILDTIRHLNRITNSTFCNVLYVGTPNEIEFDMIVEAAVSGSEVGANPLAHMRVIWIRTIDLGYGAKDVEIDMFNRDNTGSEDNGSIMLAAALRDHKVFDTTDTHDTTDTLHNSQAVLQWTTQSLWPTVSVILAAKDSQGFAAKSFKFSEDHGTFITQLLIGRVRLPRGLLDHEPRQQLLTRQERLAARVSAMSGVERKQLVTVVISHTIRVFADTAAGLHEALTKAGYSDCRILPDMSVTVMEALQDAAQASCNWATEGDDNSSDHNNNNSNNIGRPIVLQIAIGAHEVSLLLPLYIVYQMEQPAWGEVFKKPYSLYCYQAVLHSSLVVLALSHAQSDMLRDMGVSNVFTVPLYSRGIHSLTSTDQLPGSHQGVTSSTESSSSPPDMLLHAIDILFFGSCSGRRVGMLNTLNSLLSNSVVTITPAAHPASTPRQTNIEGSEYNLSSPTHSTATHRPPHVIFRCGGWINCIFDEDRDFQVQQASVVISVHNEATSSLEVHRINYLLSMGKCVVSERSLTDPELDSLYKDAVIFVDDIEEMQRVLVDLLSNPSRIREMERAGYAKYLELMNEVNVLDKALLAATEHAMQQSFKT